MFNLECTRCGATGSGEALNSAKFTLAHKKGCGAGIGITKIVGAKAKITEPVIDTTDAEVIPVETPKPKKKKAKKKSD